MEGPEGNMIPGVTFAWSSSNTSVATVNTDDSNMSPAIKASWQLEVQKSRRWSVTSRATRSRSTYSTWIIPIVV